MAHTYPIHFAAQLRQHLKALRKKHGLTQSTLAARLGVSQARIAEIESNPAVVSFEQLLQILSTLGVQLVLHDAPAFPTVTATVVEPNHAHQAKPPPDKDKTSAERQSGPTAPQGPAIQHTPLSGLENLDAAREALESNDSLTIASRALDAIETLHPARTALEESGMSAVTNQALNAFEGLDSARKAIEEFERSHAVSTALESIRGLEQARAAMEMQDRTHAERKAAESFNALSSAHRALEAYEKANAAKQALESLKGLEQARKTLAANQDVDAARKAAASLSGLDSARAAVEALNRSHAAHQALESIKVLEQAKKVFGINTDLQAMREVSGKLDTLRTYRNLLAHSKKGDW